MQSNAQKSDAGMEEIWFQYYNYAKIAQKWSLVSDLGYRLKDANFTKLSQYFIRSGIGYNLSPSMKIVFGAAYFKTHFHGTDVVTEWRPHQQLNTSHKFGNLGFGNRIRIEERFLHTNASEGTAFSNTFNFRFRYRFLFDIPLLNLSKSNVERKLSLTLGDEILCSAGKDDFLDFTAQNRFLVGPTLKLNKANKLFVIYNFTSVSKEIPTISEEFNIIWFGYKQTLDFRK